VITECNKKWKSAHDMIVRCLGYLHVEVNPDRIILCSRILLKKTSGSGYRKMCSFALRRQQCLTLSQQSAPCSASCSVFLYLFHAVLSIIVVNLDAYNHVAKYFKSQNTSFNQLYSILVTNSHSCGFWPTVLSVAPLIQCVVCRLSVCDVLFCSKTVRPI